MTKAEILKKIENSEESTKKALEVLEIGVRQLGDRNTQMLELSLNLIAASIVETMSTLSRILCEMMPEAAPEKAPEKHSRGQHSGGCAKTWPTCQCLTCARDSFDDEGLRCCVENRKHCHTNACPNYVKEDNHA